MKYFSLMLMLVFIACGNKKTPVEKIDLPSYPSASGIEYYKQHFYIIGDDANDLLITDSTFRITDSISLYHFPEKRIPKPVKADLEAITILNEEDHAQLLLLGSGSSVPYRNSGWIIDPVTKKAENIRLDTFYERFRLNGIEQINVEGICNYSGALILANRGNKSYPKNFLVFVRMDFWKNPITNTIDSCTNGCKHGQ